MIIYVDVVFAINFLMDFTIMWAAGALSKEKIKLFRLILGAALGSILYIISLIFQFRSTFLQIPAVLAAMSLSIIVSYVPNTILHLIKLVLISIVVSFVTAGGMFAFLCLSTIAKHEGFTYMMKNFSLKLLIASSVAIYVIIKLSGRYIRKGISDKREYFDINVTIGDKSFEARALADTGNSLCDCMGGSKIIVCEYDCVKKVLPDIEISADSVTMFRELSLTDFCTRIRLVPYKSIGENDGLLLGIKSDKVEISGVRKTVCLNAIICVFSGKLDSRGLYNAITNYDIFM